jgi:hypothetical protein
MKLFAVKSIAFATVLMLCITGPSYAETSPDAQTSKMAQIFKRDMLGADLAYLQQFTGVARNTEGNRKIYKVEGCEVTATVQDGKVVALRTNVSSSCTFNLNEFWSGGGAQFPVLATLTFGQFDKLVEGSFFTDCLEGCGNAADPIVYEYWKGPHANDWIDILLEVGYPSEEYGAASNKWEKAIPKTKEEDHVSWEPFCQKQPEAAKAKGL